MIFDGRQRADILSFIAKDAIYQRRNYTFKVRACNYVGVSAFSEELALLAAVTPAAPQSLSVTGSGLGSVQLRWEEPLEDGGAELISYQVYYRRTGVDTEWTQSAATLKYSQLNFEMSGLVHNTQYSFKVTAANIKG
jgi:hypothetical protein